jgi:hypothetical protein
MGKGKSYIDLITGDVLLLKDLGLESYPGFPLEENFVTSLTGADIPMFNTATGGAPSPTQGTPEFNHDGIRRLLTGSSINVGQCIDSLAGAVGGGGINISRCVAEVVWQMKAIAPSPTFSGTNSQMACFGWANTNSFTPAFAMFWYFDYAGFGNSNQWRFRVIGTGGTYNLNTGVEWSTSVDRWHTFGIRIYTGAPFAANQRIEIYAGIEGVQDYILINTITEAMLLGSGVTFPANGVPNFNLVFGNRKPAGTTVQRELRSDYIYIDKSIV